MSEREPGGDPGDLDWVHLGASLRPEQSPVTGRSPGRRSHRVVRVVIGLAVLGVVIALVLRAPSAVSDFTAAFRHFRADRLPWLVPAAVLETTSLLAMAVAQRQLLSAGGHRVALVSLLGFTVASTAIADLVPLGVAPASGWLLGQYHARGVPVALATWTVLAAGFAATTTVLGLVLLGAGLAGIWTPVGLVAAGAVLAVGAVGVVVVAHRLVRWDRWLAARFRGRLTQAVAAAIEHATRYRVSVRGGSVVFVASVLNWLCDAGVLVLAFVILGFAVPWHGVLFAYAIAQVARGLSLLPGGLGAVEGGLVGGLVFTGVRAVPALAATLVYRFVAFWAVAAVGSVVFIVLTRRWRDRLR